MPELLPTDRDPQSENFSMEARTEADTCCLTGQSSASERAGIELHCSACADQANAFELHRLIDGSVRLFRLEPFLDANVSRTPSDQGGTIRALSGPLSSASRPKRGRC